MKVWGRLLWLVLGLALGTAGTLLVHQSQSRPALAGTDHTQDYIITTGPITLGTGVNGTADAIWMLDYRAGKLLGTAVDPNIGRIRAWDEVDLVKDFGISPKQDVHFIMTTGATIKGHTPVYLAEINTGQLAIYGMTPRIDGSIMIRKFESTIFRRPPPNPNP